MAWRLIPQQAGNLPLLCYVSERRHADTVTDGTVGELLAWRLIPQRSADRTRADLCGSEFSDARNLLTSVARPSRRPLSEGLGGDFRRVPEPPGNDNSMKKRKLSEGLGGPFRRPNSEPLGAPLKNVQKTVEFAEKNAKDIFKRPLNSLCSEPPSLFTNSRHAPIHRPTTGFQVAMCSAQTSERTYVCLAARKDAGNARSELRASCWISAQH